MNNNNKQIEWIEPIIEMTLKLKMNEKSLAKAM